ncbi:GNAT family N-acetyltransferase [Rhodoferax lacus]|uniref:GNAT family N-acetyltransferase n=1 Tax=Rhodoferax lacus TaxID=2184758 RepID=A0A3E1RHY2_9BURK|nr:GNAT family N-acetyltransferase [Rhodoferax lacus]RFO98220.1 GNAT family N-acetyltransferase [Rhodoferax lacus]
MLTIRPPEPSDRAAWDSLYQGYADFYQVVQTPEMRERVWGWLQDPAHECQCLMAFDAEGKALGLAHFRAFARPLSASTGGFLDDLFVDPAARGSQAGTQLIAAVRAHAEKHHWSVVRWITADNNYRARSAYDKIATRTAWITYDIKL